MKSDEDESKTDSLIMHRVKYAVNGTLKWLHIVFCVCFIQSHFRTEVLLFRNFEIHVAWFPLFSCHTIQ
jgi:hypothetical protein